MHVFAGNVRVEWPSEIEGAPFNVIKNETNAGTTFFLYGKTTFASSKELVDFIAGRVAGKILSYDVSIDTEDRLVLVQDEPLDWRYGFVAVHGKDFTEAVSVSKTLPWKVISIREAEPSDKLGGRVIKIDVLG